MCQPSLHSTYQIVAATGPTPFGVESRRWAIRSGLRQQLRELFKLTPFVEELEIAQVPIMSELFDFRGLEGLPGAGRGAGRDAVLGRRRCRKGKNEKQCRRHERHASGTHRSSSHAGRDNRIIAHVVVEFHRKAIKALEN